MTAIGLSADRLPDLTGGERLFLGCVAAVFLGLLWAQWGSRACRLTMARPGVEHVMGVVSSLMALSMFVCLIPRGTCLPQGSCSLSMMMLLQVVYLTTWE